MDEPRTWQPSSRPPPEAPSEVVQVRRMGLAARTGELLRRPRVRLLIGLLIFLAAAQVYEMRYNYGSWTERELREEGPPDSWAPGIQTRPDP